MHGDRSWCLRSDFRTIQRLCLLSKVEKLQGLLLSAPLTSYKPIEMCTPFFWVLRRLSGESRWGEMIENSNPPLIVLRLLDKVTLDKWFQFLHTGAA